MIEDRKRERFEEAARLKAVDDYAKSPASLMTDAFLADLIDEVA